MKFAIPRMLAPFALLVALGPQAAVAQDAAPAADPAPAPAAVADATLSYSNKWRIEVSEGANSDGEIVFNVTPKGGTTTVVTVKIDDGTSEDHVARDIRKAFRKQLDTSKYDIEVDDGEDVLVKKDLTEPAFALVLVSNNLKGTRLNVQKE